MSNKPRVRTTTTAVATVTVEISGLGSWGPDCKLEQVYAQARESAERAILKALQGSSMRIVGNANIQAITTDVERRHRP